MLRGTFQLGFPCARVLAQEHPAADINHQRGRNEHDDRFKLVTVPAVEEDHENSRRKKAGNDSCSSAAVEIFHIACRVHLDQESSQRCDHENGLKALAQKNCSRLKCNRYGVHALTPQNMSYKAGMR